MRSSPLKYVKVIIALIITQERKKNEPPIRLVGSKFDCIFWKSSSAYDREFNLLKNYNPPRTILVVNV